MPKDELSVLINTINDMIVNGTNFVTGSVPEVVNQILRYGFLANIIGVVVGSIIVILGVILAIHFLAKVRDGYDDGYLDAGDYFMVLTPTIILPSLVSIPVLVTSIGNLLLLNTAPLVYVLARLTIK